MRTSGPNTLPGRMTLLCCLLHWPNSNFWTVKSEMSWLRANQLQASGYVLAVPLTISPMFFRVAAFFSCKSGAESLRVKHGKRGLDWGIWEQGSPTVWDRQINSLGAWHHYQHKGFESWLNSLFNVLKWKPFGWSLCRCFKRVVNLTLIFGRSSGKRKQTLEGNF